MGLTEAGGGGGRGEGRLDCGIFGVREDRVTVGYGSTVGLEVRGYWWRRSIVTGEEGLV